MKTRTVFAVDDRGCRTVRAPWTPFAPMTSREFGQLAVVVGLLNAGDALFTLAWVRMSHATEANVLLAALIEDPVAFFAVKMSLAVLGLAMLWLHRNRPIASAGLGIVFVAYAWVLGVHLGHASTLMADAVSP